MSAVSRGVALFLVGLTAVLIATCVAGVWLSETAVEVAAWGALGLLAVLAAAAAWALLRDASDRHAPR